MSPLLPHISVAVRSALPDGYDGVGGPEWLETALRQALAQILGHDTVGQVSLLLADDDTVRQLNREYRGVDHATDVLSFSAEHSGHWEGGESAGPATPEGWGEDDGVLDFPIPEDEPPPLGDIVISVPQAIRQAEAQGVPLLRELALLIVHGVLHLLGHDHYEDGERSEMQRLERLTLAEIFSNTDAGSRSAPSSQS